MFLVYDSEKKASVPAYEGATLKVWSDYIQIMSDVWEPGVKALVWSEEKGMPTGLSYVYEFNTTRPESEIYKVDATPEVIEKYRAWAVARKVADLKFNITKAANIPSVGSVIRVVKGRESQGVEGKVFKIIDRPYRSGWNSHNENKLGVATSDEMIEVPGKYGKVFQNYKDVIWVWARNVEVVNPNIDFSEVETMAAEYADLVVSDLKVTGAPRYR